MSIWAAGLFGTLLIFDEKYYLTQMSRNRSALDPEETK